MVYWKGLDLGFWGASAVNQEIRSKAQALAEALANSDEYKELKEAKEELERHEAARIMFRDFRQKREALERKALSGQTPSDEEIQALQQAYQIVALNPYVRRVLEAEVAFAAMMAEVQRILAEAVGIELPEGLQPDQAGQAGRTGQAQAAEAGSGQGEGSPSLDGARQNRDQDDGGKPRPRLWVPGR